MSHHNRGGSSSTRRSLQTDALARPLNGINDDEGSTTLLQLPPHHRDARRKQLQHLLQSLAHGSSTATTTSIQQECGKLLDQKQEERDHMEAEKLPILSRIQGCLVRTGVVYNSDGENIGTQVGTTSVSMDILKEHQRRTNRHHTTTRSSSSFEENPGVRDGLAAVSRAANKFVVRDSDEVNQLFHTHMTSSDLREQLHELTERSDTSSRHHHTLHNSTHDLYSSHQGTSHLSLQAPLRQQVHLSPLRSQQVTPTTLATNSSHVTSPIHNHTAASESPLRTFFAHEISGSPITFDPEVLSHRAQLTRRLLLGTFRSSHSGDVATHRDDDTSTEDGWVTDLTSSHFRGGSTVTANAKLSHRRNNNRMDGDGRVVEAPRRLLPVVRPTTQQRKNREETELWQFQLDALSSDARRAAIQHVEKSVSPPSARMQQRSLLGTAKTNSLCAHEGEGGSQVAVTTSAVHHHRGSGGNELLSEHGRPRWMSTSTTFVAPHRSRIDPVLPGATTFANAPVPQACRVWSEALAQAGDGPIGKNAASFASLSRKLAQLEKDEAAAERRRAAAAASSPLKHSKRHHLGATEFSDEDGDELVPSGSAFCGGGLSAQKLSSLGGAGGRRPSGGPAHSGGGSRVFRRAESDRRKISQRENSSLRQVVLMKQASSRFASVTRQKSGRSSDLRGGGVDAMADVSLDDGDAAAALLRKKKANGLWGEWIETYFVSARAGVEAEAESEMQVEEDTNMPAQDLHLYQLYCAHLKTTIILRPISNSVVDLYAGTAILDASLCDEMGNPIPQPDMPARDIRAATSFECRVKGKSISVSLKSSPFAPIGGLIPVNPALGKAYLDAVKREREMEDLILNAQGGVMTIALLKRLKAQKAQAGSLTAAFVRDIHQSLLTSNKECRELLAEYQAEVTMTIDKSAVSKRYIDRLNNAQFLGTTQALWHGLPVHYNEGAVDGVERLEEGGCPVFYIKRSDGKYYPFNQSNQNLDKTPVLLESVWEHFRPVEVVTHRTFFVSPVTQRIEEDPSSYLIGPDFDGLCYAQNVHFVNAPLKDTIAPYTSEDHIKWAEAHATTRPVTGMGLIYDCDEEHIRELREMTQWKHNHGYECANTVKSQPMTPGPYVLITPTNARLLTSFEEIIGYYRWAWLDGTPLILSPNWKVVLLGGLPIPYGEDLTLPIVDDCGYGAFMLEVDSNHLNLKEVTGAYVCMKCRVEEARERAAKAASSHLQSFHKAAKTTAILTNLSIAQREYALVQDKKFVAQRFFALRRWQLMPTLFNADEDGYVLGTKGTSHMGSGVLDVVDENGDVLEYSIEHSTTTSAKEHFTIDTVFEQHRAARLQVVEEEFETVAAMFDELNPSATAFTALLHSFIYPDTDIL